MKTMIHRSQLLALFMFMPCFLSAQWNMVRFDEYNFFTNVATTAPSSAIVSGMDPMGGSFIMRTNDGGTTWDSIVVNSPGSTYTISELCFTDNDNGFAGGTKNTFQALLKTTDNGSTWSDITPDPSSINQINAISFTDPSIGYATDETNLYQTLNSGSTWTTTVPGFGIKDINFLDANNGYACGEFVPNAVVMKTNDGGQTWSNVLSATFQFFANSSMQKLDVITTDVVYCSALYTTNLFRTTDGGMTWDTITLSQIYGIQDYDFVNALEGHVLSTMGEIYGTVDGGQTWVLEYAVASGSYGPSVFLNSISFAGTTGYVCGSNGLIKKYTLSPTGLQQPIGNTISWYPNPLSGNQSLQLTGIVGAYRLRVFNNEGQVVYSNNKMQNNQLALNLPSGIYTMEVISDQNTFRDKIVIIN